MIFYLFGAVDILLVWSCEFTCLEFWYLLVWSYGDYFSGILIFYLSGALIFTCLEIRILLVWSFDFYLSGA